MPSPQAIKLLDRVTATGAGAAFPMSPHFPGAPARKATFQAAVTGDGAVSATVDVEVSNDETHWERVGTLSISGTDDVHDGFTMDAPWVHVRGNVTAISGTDAALTLTKGA